MVFGAFLRCVYGNLSGRRNRMDDEERLLSCQKEIRRLRNAVRQLKEDARQYEEILQVEMESESGLMRAMELWQEIQNGE